MICKLCKKDKKLIKAHIIPEFLYRDTNLYDDKHHLHGIKNNTNEKRIQSFQLPMGIYDKTILCEDCDSKIIKKYDDCGKQFFQKLLSKATIQSALLQKSAFFEIDNPLLFKSFIASVFWRASISNNPKFKVVHLDEKEDVIREVILTGNEKFVDDFDVAVFFLNNEIGNDYLMNFIEINKCGHHFFAIFWGGFLINLFPDKNKMNFLKEFVIMKNDFYRIKIFHDTEVSKNMFNNFIGYKFF